MITRTYAYGTTLAVTVLHVEMRRTTLVAVCQHEDNPTEATIVMLDVAQILHWRPKAGERRTLEFRRGGPTGGHWGFLPGLREDKPATEGTK